MFDPEKVERFEIEFVGEEPTARLTICADGNYVWASDYDQLLAAYRKAVPIPDTRDILEQALDLNPEAIAVALCTSDGKPVYIRHREP